jgi:hypothetical protein
MSSAVSCENGVKNLSSESIDALLRFRVPTEGALAPKMAMGRNDDELASSGEFLR